MKNPFKKISGNHKKAETLVEVIMAIFIVLIGSGAATVLIVSSIRANTFNKDNLVGMNLAVEGMEAVRIIRDTNWIKFSYDKANCWNMLPDKLAGATCDGLNLIQDGNYTVDLNPTNYSWTLTKPPGTALDLANIGAQASNDDYRMVFIDLDDEFDSNSNGDPTDDTDLVVSKEGANAAFLEGLTQTGQTRFYRMVTISYPNDPDMDTMNVESLVQWRSSSAGVHQVLLSGSLTNFNRVKVN